MPATKKRDLKKKCRREMINATILEGIALLYIGMILGAAYINVPSEILLDPTSNPTILDAVFYLPDYVIENPLGIWPTHILGVGTTMMVWLVAFMYNYQRYVRKYKTMYDGAHGTAQFNNDLKDFLLNFVLDPKIVNRPGNKVAHLIFMAVKAAIISAALGAGAIFLLKLPKSKAPGIIVLWLVLFGIEFLLSKCKKEVKKVGNGKRITTRKLRYGIEKKHKISALKRFLCRITPNTIQPAEFEECLEKSVIQSNEVRLSINTKWSQRVINSIIFGATGTGKSRFVMKPNILQANSSYVITDPKGELLRDTGGFLKEKGYTIKVVNLKDLAHTMRYNPLHYCKTQEDIPKVVDVIIKNIDGIAEGNKNSGGDGDFWNQSAKNIFMAIVAYMFEVFTDSNEFLEDGSPNPHWEGHKNLLNVLNMLRMSEIREEEGESISELDALFAELAENNHNSYAVRQYQVFKTSSSKTAMNILISTLVKLNLFDNDAFQNVTFKDELELDKVSTEKTALYVILPVNNTTFNFLASILFTQLFEILYDQGDANGGSVEIPVQFLLDEMANLGKIPSLNTKLTTMRSYCISVTMVFQTYSQLKNYDKNDYETLLANCDTLIYLGSTEKELLKYLSERLGKETINTMSYGTSGKGSSDNKQQIGHPLLDANEIELMDNADSLIFVRGNHPFFTPKFHLEEHKNFKYLGDSGTKHAISYDIGQYYTQYDEDSIRNSFVRPYSDPKHTVPRLLDKYKDAAGNPIPLSIDNFSRKMDKRVESISGGEVKTWKALFDVSGVEKPADTKADTKVARDKFDVDRYKDLRNVNEADKEVIRKKLDAMSDKRFVNISEEEFKMFANVLEECSEEEILAWCMENLEVDDSFSPGYEFSAEEDFLIGNFASVEAPKKQVLEKVQEENPTAEVPTEEFVSDEFIQEAEVDDEPEYRDVVFTEEPIPEEFTVYTEEEMQLPFEELADSEEPSVSDVNEDAGGDVDLSDDFFENITEDLE